MQVRGTCAESSFCETVRVKFCSDERSFWVPEPKLWWPRGYGPASLYRTQVELLHHGEVQDVWELNLGIRTFEVQTNFVPGDDGIQGAGKRRADPLQGCELGAAGRVPQPGRAAV